MTYQEAKALAMKHPGAVVTRDDSGEFIIIANDGNPIGHVERREAQNLTNSKDGGLEADFAANAAIVRRLRSELDEAWKAIFSLRKTVPSALIDLPGIEDLNREVRTLKDEIAGLRKLVDRIPSRAWARFDEESAAIRAEKRAEKQKSELEKKSSHSEAALITRQSLMSRLRLGDAAPYELRLVLENPVAFDATPEDLKLAIKLLREG